MKFSENWLREFVDPDLSTSELVEQLTMAGLEVDSVEPVAAWFSGIVVGEILEVAAHPDADKLVVCRVSSGAEELQVVCGAPNARAGIKVPFALVGGQLPDLKIKKAKLRGVESFGMLCSERELGLSDNHAGLMELPFDAPVGENIRDYLSLDDTIIEVDLTPNRSDCLGILGLAREAAILGDLVMKPPAAKPVAATIDDVFPVELHAPDACPRFVGRIIRNIDTGAKSPLWLVEKLRRSGIRSIDPVVDVTNLIMLELGQPMHAYDLDKLTGKIIVRQSRAGDQVTLLDGAEVTLEDGTLLITDESGPIGIAGIMGGLSTSVTRETRNIYLESAFFAPMAIAGKARSYGMHTDASHRFERGVDWANQVRATERATALLLDICGGEAGPTRETVVSDSLPPEQEVRLRASRVKRMLGVEISDNQIDHMLSQLHFDSKRISGPDTTWIVSAPSHRFDIAIEADLIEEISRIYGYNTLPVRTPKTHLAMVPAPEGTLELGRVKQQLVSRGYFEAITYSFVDNASSAALDPENEPISLSNPLSSEMGVMRTSLWPGLIKSLIYNRNRQQERVRLFETGLRFRQPPNQPELKLDAITQELMLAGVACGKRHPENWADSTEAVDFYDVKGDLESIFQLSRCFDSFHFEQASHPALHPGQSAKIVRDGEEVGYLGLLDPRVQQALDLDLPVYLFEMRVGPLLDKSLAQVASVSRQPETRRDIAVILARSVVAGDVRKCIKNVDGETLTNLKLFDVYQGKGIDPARKSMALGLTFQHPSRTLTEDEINQSMEQIVAALASELGASLRG